MTPIPQGFQEVNSLPSSVSKSVIPAGFSPVDSTLPSAPSDFSQLESGLKGAIAAAATGGQNIYNTARNILQKTGRPLLKEIGMQNVPSLPRSTQNFYNTLNVPQYARTGLPGFGENMIQYLPTLGNPIGEESGIANLANKAANSVNGIFPKLLSTANNAIKYLSPRVGRVGQQATAGALLSQNPEQGAESFGGTQAVIEGANPLLKMAMSPLHGIANLVTPINAAKNFGLNLQNVYKNVKSGADVAYSARNPFKDKSVVTGNPQNLIDPENYKYFPLSIKRKINSFYENPSIQNAHELQSDMFSIAHKIDPLTYDDIDKKEALLNAREPLLNAITTRLNKWSPSAGDSYNQGRYIYQNQLSKLTPTPFFSNAAHGEIDTNDPEQIIREYKKAFPTKSAMPNNYLTEGVNNLKNRIGLGHFLQYAVPMGVGAFGAHTAGAGLMGDLLGAGGGGAFARFEEAPMIKNMLQNEGLHNALAKLGRGSRKTTNVLIPGIAGEFNQNNQ